MHRDFKGIWIPREIWLHETLSLQAKALWAEIDWLYDREKGGCYASDQYLMDFIGIKLSRLHELMKELKDCGLLEKVSFDGRERIIRALHPTVENESPGGTQPSGKAEPCIPENRKAVFRKTGTPSYNIGTNIVTKKKKKRNASILLISFDYELFEFVNITDEHFADWKELYPGIDIYRELLAMKIWAKDPEKPEIKSAKSFINNWLSKSYKESLKTPKPVKSSSSVETNEPKQYLEYLDPIAQRYRRESEAKYVDYLKRVSDKSYYKAYLEELGGKG